MCGGLLVWSLCLWCRSRCTSAVIGWSRPSSAWPATRWTMTRLWLRSWQLTMSWRWCWTPTRSRYWDESGVLAPSGVQAVSKRSLKVKTDAAPSPAPRVHYFTPLISLAPVCSLNWSSWTGEKLPPHWLLSSGLPEDAQKNRLSPVVQLGCRHVSLGVGRWTGPDDSRSGFISTLNLNPRSWPSKLSGKILETWKWDKTRVQLHL